MNFIKRAILTVADYASRYSPTHQNNQARVLELESTLEKAIQERETYKHRVENLGQGLRNQAEIYSRRKEELENKLAEANQTARLAHQESLRYRIKVRRKLEELEQAAKTAASPNFRRALSSLPPEELARLNINQSLLAEQRQLQKDYEELAGQNLELKAHGLSNAARTLSETNRKFARAPIAIYTPDGEPLHESRTFLKYSRRLQIDPQELIVQLAERKTKTLDDFEIHYTSFTASDKLAAISLSLTPLARKDKKRRHRVIAKARDESIKILQAFWQRFNMRIEYVT